jgi:phage-related holin
VRRAMQAGLSEQVFNNVNVYLKLLFVLNIISLPTDLPAMLRFVRIAMQAGLFEQIVKKLLVFYQIIGDWLRIRYN